MLQAERMANAMGVPVEEYEARQETATAHLEDIRTKAAVEFVDYTITAQNRLFMLVVLYIGGLHLTSTVFPGIPYGALGCALIVAMVAANFLHLKCFTQLDALLSRMTDASKERVAAYAQCRPYVFNKFSYTPGFAGQVIDFLQRMSGEITWLAVFGIGVYHARTAEEGYAIVAGLTIISHLVITFAFATRRNRGADCLFVDQPPTVRRLRDFANLALAGMTLLIAFGFSFPLGL